MSLQLALFETPAPTGPDGFAYRPEVITPGEEQALAARFAALPFKPYEFRGYLGARRTVAFGWRYADGGKAIEQVQAIPDFLLAVRDKAAAFAGLEPEALAQAMVIDYPPGAPIGWHRDRPAFETVLGISLKAPCSFRLRRRVGEGFARAAIALQPRSVYALTGEVRTAWEHSIPPVKAHRYSITFRNFRGETRGLPAAR